MKKKLLLIIVVIQICCGCAKYSKNMSKVWLVNKASNEIVLGILSVCDKKFELRNLKPQREEGFTFTPCSDDHYLIKIEFSTGKKLEKELGYITSGFNYKDKFIVTDDDIVMNDRMILK